MSPKNAFPIPDRVKPEDRLEFVLRLAALYHNPTGSLRELSEALGASGSLLHMSIKQPGGLMAEHCVKIEKLLGRDCFPREFLRPDIFVAE